MLSSKPLQGTLQGGLMQNSEKNILDDKIQEPLSSVDEIVSELLQGQFIILVDDENRENEGDLICLAEKITPEMINFICTYARGMMCLAITKERADQLGLELQPRRNHHNLYTAFTTSIEAKSGITTGISVADRHKTIQDAINPNFGTDDIATPGHIFPIVADEQGVLSRAGHTEAAVDLAKISGSNPAAVICEIMNPDGTMARLPELILFAKKHNIKIGKIEDLINYRKNK